MYNYNTAGVVTSDWSTHISTRSQANISRFANKRTGCHGRGGNNRQKSCRETHGRTTIPLPSWFTELQINSTRAYVSVSLGTKTIIYFNRINRTVCCCRTVKHISRSLIIIVGIAVQNTAASSGDCSTEHSLFAAAPCPWRFWWKLSFRQYLQSNNGEST